MIRRQLFFGDRTPGVFLATLWLALATVLASALLPLGLPLTKSVGSAFSPSTTIVALNAKPLRLRPAGKKLVLPGDGDKVLQGVAQFDAPHATLPVVAPVLPVPHADEGLFPPHRTEPLSSRALPESAYPRGPPMA